MTEFLDADAALREQAIQRLKKRRDFGAHLLIYVLVNVFLVVIWTVTTMPGFFWPVFPIVGWGIAVVMNAWDVWHGEEFTEAQVEQEMAKLQKLR